MCLCFLFYLHIGVKEPDLTEPPGLEAAENTTRQHRYASGQYFFEYLVVVSLKKAKDSNTYEPQITYQFPKVSMIVKAKYACLPLCLVG